MTELPVRYEWPITYDFSVRTGDTKKFRIALDDDAGVLDDLDFASGYTFLAEVARTAGPTETHVAEIEVTVVGPKILECHLTSGECGKLRSLLNTKGIGKAVWDLQVTQLDPLHVFTLAAGKVSLRGDVARED